MESVESTARYLASTIARQLFETNILDHDFVDEIPRDVISRITGRPYRKTHKECTKEQLNTLTKALTLVKKDSALTPVLTHNLTFLTNILSLPNYCIPVIQLCVITTLNQGLHALLEEHIRHFVEDSDLLIAQAIGITLDELEQAVKAISNTSLFEQKDSSVFGLLIMPFALATNLMQQEATTYTDLLHGMYYQTEPSHLSIKDYPHLELDYISEYLKLTVQNRDAGINILLYGPAGTGKTELSKVLSKYAKSELIAVKAAGENKFRVADELTSDSNVAHLRLQHYRLMQSLFKPSHSSCLLLDEAEDIFFNYLDGTRVSKERIHTVLETNVAPCFWITNHISMLPHSVIRRFSYVLEMPTPPKQIKAEILAKPLKGLRLSQTYKETLANIPDLTPAHVVNASAVAKSLGLTGSAAAHCIDEHVHNTLAACGFETSIQNYQNETDFNPDYINIKPNGKSSITSIDTLIQSVKHFNGSRTLLIGVPGCGKSQLVRHLADELEQELLVIQPADVLDMYVGQSEKRIRALFDEAHRLHKVILIDECDSIINQRANAKNSWERSVVNQLLLSIERCTQTLFLCSNFDTDLDSALKRRIDFKVELDYLTAEQTVKIYEEHFGKCSTAIKRKLSQLKRVTPGDMAVLARRNRFSKQTLSDSENIKILTAEIQHKQPDKSIGFIH